MMKISYEFKSKIILLVFLLILSCSLYYLPSSLSRNSRSNWLQSSHWGVFVHFLTNSNTTAKEWNRIIDNFDTEGLAKQLESIRANYIFITIGQNSGHYCAPNSTYDFYVKTYPSKCSNRDLISDLHKALNHRGIKLLVYLPSGAPALDRQAVLNLDWINGPHRNKIFQKKWENIIQTWSIHWGKKVDGWWFDGIYWPREMYRFSESPNFKSFATAARAGNPSSIIAFNPGVLNPIIKITEEEDYTAGEINNPQELVCKGRWINGSQYHILSYLGSGWNFGKPRFTNNEVIRISNNIIKCGGVITWDVPVFKNGHIPEVFLNQLLELSKKTN
jgi:hypothetical protein